MAELAQEKFEDPALKSAVRRCWMCDCASEQLRARVIGIMQATHESGQRESGTLESGQQMGNHSPVSRSTNRSMVFRIPRSTWMLAAAAVIVLAFGLSLKFMTGVTLPSPLQADLVVRHDLCCQDGDHQHLVASRNNDSAIASELQNRLFRPVLVARPADPGWTFRGAAICPVGTIPAGHLVFARGTDTLSIFSLPKSVAPKLKDGDEFAMTENGHSIAGFEKNGALFCLVANSPTGTLTKSQLETMRAGMEADVTVAQSNAPEPVAIAELLRPSGQ